MKLLLNFIETHSVNYALINGYLTVFLLIAIAIIIALYLRLKEAKTWIKFSDIEKKQNQHELKEEKAFSETQGSMYSKLLVKYADMNKAFEDAVAEITSLRSKLKFSYESSENLGKRFHEDQLKIESLNKALTYWKERALHQKHSKPVKQVESEWYECLSTEYDKNIFVKYGKYKKSTLLSTDKSENLLGLVANNGVSYLVFKSDFKPVLK